MDWYPLWNSLRIALVSCAAVFFLGIFAAYYLAKLPRTVKGAPGNRTPDQRRYRSMPEVHQLDDRCRPHRHAAQLGGRY